MNSYYISMRIFEEDHSTFGEPEDRHSTTYLAASRVF
jgi:hypothetical protein